MYKSRGRSLRFIKRKIVNLKMLASAKKYYNLKNNNNNRKRLILIKIKILHFLKNYENANYTNISVYLLKTIDK